MLWSSCEPGCLLLYGECNEFFLGKDMSVCVCVASYVCIYICIYIYVYVYIYI